MAFYQYRGRKVSVFFWDGTKQVALPRRVTRHLDGEPEAIVQEWVNRWSNLNEVKKVRPELSAVPNLWSETVDRWCDQLTKMGRDEKTIKDHRRHLLTALPFFTTAGCESWADFPNYSRKLGPWLLSIGKTERRIHAINQSMRLFWKWLDDEGLAEGLLKLTGGFKTKQRTPLKITIKPEEILSFKPERDDIRLLALIGYFFSLRPQEVIALRPMDFKAGSATSDIECCKALGSAGLYNRLAVYIHRQRTNKGFRKPKMNSIGWVGCFDERAARELVKLMVGRPHDQPLFEHGLFWYIKLWKRHGLPNTVTKDMRRASLYHLGHYSDLPVVALKNHARHQNMETTMLYTRRPEELGENDWGHLDLDAE